MEAEGGRGGGAERGAKAASASGEGQGNPRHDKNRKRRIRGGHDAPLHQISSKAEGGLEEYLSR